MEKKGEDRGRRTGGCKEQKRRIKTEGRKR